MIGSSGARVLRTGVLPTNKFKPLLCKQNLVARKQPLKVLRSSANISSN